MLNIQQLEPAEVDRLRRIRIRSLRDAPHAFSGTYEEAAARSTEAWTRQIEALPTFVAVSGREDVGLVRAGRVEDPPGTAFLLSMWVAPEVRGEGVGDAPIDAIVGWARSSGVVRLVLDVGEANEPAVSLYVRKGFVRTGETSALSRPEGDVSEFRMFLEIQ